MKKESCDKCKWSKSLCRCLTITSEASVLRKTNKELRLRIQELERELADARHLIAEMCWDSADDWYENESKRMKGQNGP